MISARALFGVGTARRRGPGGFTLIELLVVVSIIAMLMAMLMPALGRARKTAEQVGCLSNMRQLSTAMRMYAGEWSDVMPWQLEPFVSAPELGRWWYTQSTPIPILLGYDKMSKAVFEQGGHSVFNCPGASGQRASTDKPYVDYDANAYVMKWHAQYSWHTISSIREASGVVVLTDRGIGRARTYFDNYWWPFPDEVGNYHMGQTNVLYMDSHADSRLPESITVGEIVLP